MLGISLMWLVVQATITAQCIGLVGVGVSLSALKGCTSVIQCDVLLRLLGLYASELLGGDP